MRIVASSEAIDLASERGGRLYVWTKARRCCHGAQTWLEVAHEPPAGADFQPAGAEGAVEVFLPSTLARRPDELHLDVHGFRRKRVEAYWDGCAWVV